MNTENDDDSNVFDDEFDDETAELDFELGRMAADAVIEQQYTEFEFAFEDECEPCFVYRKGDQFLVIETEVLDEAEEEEDASYGKVCRDGLVYERGTREYLETSVDEWLSIDDTQEAAYALSQALTSHRVEYLLVTVKVSDTEVSSIECTSFEL